MIFFTNGQRSHHTGIVTEVTSSRVKTIEGNTSGASGVIENGGGVCRKSYRKDYGQILGYGIPDWSLVELAKNPAGSRRLGLEILPWRHRRAGTQ